MKNRMLNKKYMILVLITAMWFLLVMVRFQASFNNQEQTKTAREVKLADSFRGAAWVCDKKETLYITLKDGLFKNSLEMYKNALVETPSDINILESMVIVNYELGNLNESKTCIKKIKKYGFEKESFVLENILINKKAEEKNKINIAKNQIIKLFYGVNRDRILYYFYSINNLEKDKAALESAKKESASRRIYNTAFFLLMILPLFFLGAIFLFLFAIKLFKGKRYVEEKITEKISLEKAWLVFILWDLLHLLAGFIVYAAKIKISSVASMVIIYIFISILPLVFIFYHAGIRRFVLSKSSYFRDALWGFGGYCAILPVIFVASVANQIIFQNTTISSNPVFVFFENIKTPFDYMLLLFMVVIIGPAVEEILFRGYLYTAFRKYFNFTFSVLIVSFLFSFIHADVFALIPIFCIGFVLSAVYEYTGSVISSFIAHALWNLNTFLAFILFFK